MGLSICKNILEKEASLKPNNKRKYSFELNRAKSITRKISIVGIPDNMSR